MHDTVDMRPIACSLSCSPNIIYLCLRGRPAVAEQYQLSIENFAHVFYSPDRNK